MKRFLFILGRTPELGFLELQSLYPSITRLSAGIAVLDGDVDAKAAMMQLGGTIKIAQMIGEVSEIQTEQLVDVLVPLSHEGKIVFGVSVYGDPTKVSASVLRALKNELVNRNIVTRYIEAKHESTLSSVVVTKQHAVDLVIVVHNGVYILAHTVAVQDFEDWNVRDFGRPAADPKRGMLPPKVARMIVNIAGSTETSGKRTLLDPFCGVGTILGEALLADWNVVGSDIDPVAIVKTEKNLAWLRSQYGLLQRTVPALFTVDATHISTVQKSDSVDAIVTEPFMGDPSFGGKHATVTHELVKNTLKGLEKLYIGCLREWTHVLKSGGQIVIALPEYSVQGRVLTVKSIVDRCESLGYTLVAGPIEYSRPQAMVRRQFFVFKKK
jgi:tRNA G10  N-methylase Trm11